MSERDGAGDVRSEDSFDEGALAQYLRRTFPEHLDGSVSVSQFPGGHSNLTYLVRFGAREAVLRRAPHGALVRSAHDMRREFDVLSALSPLYSKAPKALAYCEDASVIGAPFYLMQRIPGIVLRGPALPAGVDLTPSRMQVLSEALVDALVELHALDVTSGPLAALGQPEGYAARQVGGWTDRWRRARTEEVPDLDAAAAWLAENVPPAGRPALVHNDFKYDNLVLDPEDPTRVAAVLDWEMATLGDPVLDLGTTLGYWIDPDDPPGLKALPLGTTLVPGNRTRAEVAERWAAAAGREPHVLFAYVFGLFKIATIAQQLYRRFAEGRTTDPRFAALLHAVRALGSQASRALARNRIHRLG